MGDRDKAIASVSAMKKEKMKEYGGKSLSEIMITLNAPKGTIQKIDSTQKKNTNLGINVKTKVR